MYFYKIEYSISNIYDGNPLEVKPRALIYTDEAMTDLLTELPSSNLGVYITVAECPQTSKADFETYVTEKMMEKINTEEIQDKLNEVKLVRDLGLLT